HPGGAERGERVPSATNLILGRERDRLKPARGRGCQPLPDVGEIEYLATIAWSAASKDGWRTHEACDQRLRSSHVLHSAGVLIRGSPIRRYTHYSRRHHCRELVAHRRRHAHADWLRVRRPHPTAG